MAANEILAARLQNVRPSDTKAMTQRAEAMRAQGRRIITLSQGEPDFDTPPNIRAAGIRAINEGMTRYTAVAGIRALRDAICAKLSRDNQLQYTTEQITVGCGAKQVIFNGLLASLNPGDEVILPAPMWVSYSEMVKLAEGRPVAIACAEDAGFKLTPAALAAAITGRTRWLFLNSPCNPTGAVYSTAELRALAEVLRWHPHVWIMSDDIYEKLIYDDLSFATMAQVAPDLHARTLTVNGLSKAYCMTGWRLGYGAGALRLIQAMNVVQGQTTSHTSSISQAAAVEALNGDQSYLPSFVNEFALRRELVVGLLNQAPGLRCRMPAGAFYAFPSCAGVIGRKTPAGQILTDDVAFANYLLETAGVAVVPGSSFSASPYIRVSYASAREELQAAGQAIIAACARLQ